MKLFELLLESRVDFLRAKYIPLIRDNYKIPLVHAQHFFYRFIDNDPTNNKIYLQWLLNETLKTFKTYKGINNFVIEDAYKWKEYLKIYDKVKSKLPIEQRDINKLSLEDLKDIALQYKEKEEEILTKNDYLDKKYKINETNQYLVYMFKTATKQDFKMYQLVSTNTEWCTRPSYKTFADYISRSPLFIFINKQNRNLKYQFHEEDNQFMDYKDKSIDDELIIKLISLIKNYLPEDFLLKINIDGLWGYINKDGKIIAKGFKYANSFYEGFARVKFNDNSWGYINKDGKITSKGFKYANSFYEGFARVQFNDNSYGFINKDGKIIAKGFKNAWTFNEGFAMVLFNDNSYGYISKDLKLYAKDKKTLINNNDPRRKGIELFPENL